MKKSYTKAMNTLKSLSTLLLLILLLGVQSVNAQCTNDTIPPLVFAPADTTIDCIALLDLGIYIDSITANTDLSIFGNATATDNCPSSYAVELPPQIHDTNSCGTGQIIRLFKAVDASGNVSLMADTQIISVVPSQNVSLHVPSDYHPTDPVIDTLTLIYERCGLHAKTYSDLVFDVNCDGVADKVIRSWTALDWCTGVPTMELPRLDLDGDQVDGDAYDIQVIGDSTYRMEGGVAVEALGVAAGLFTYNQIIRYNDGSQQIAISGTLFDDNDSDCLLGMGENGLAGWSFKLLGLSSGRIYPVVTDAQGAYEINICNIDTSFEIHLETPINYMGSCVSNFAQQVPSGTQNLQLDIPIALATDCPLLYVDISAARLRRCVNNSYYVNYCNYSDELIDSVRVEVQLDPLMTYTNSSIPGSLVNGKWIFELGAVDAGECGRFRVFFDLSCDAVFGQTHCSTAHIYPDTICEPAGANWSGASIEVDGICDGDSVRMNISNIGTGNMAAPLNYIVVEDVLMRADGDFELNSGGTMQVPLDANGATWYLTAEQEPGHPGQSMPSIAIEGCGGLNSPGLATAFIQNDANPFVSIDCQQNRGSYDPNDKQVSPAGVGPDHLVTANTQLEYLIRFQNTGTDTAFKVEILDTLSPLLDQATIIPGASSHPYTFEYPEANVIRFAFNNIMLPDSNINEAASHGFIKFSIAQQADLPNGSRIENDAAIYFDFNEPVITNTTFLTIGEDIFGVVSGSQKVFQTGVEVAVYPNPVNKQASFQIKGLAAGTGQLSLYNMNGQLIRQQSFSSTTFDVNVSSLSEGMYFYQLSNLGGQLIGSGKLAVY